MADAKIKHMVDRFLTWPVPADFSPDGGVKFEPSQLLGGGFHRPVGTNIFTATQATAMVEHMLEGLPVEDAYDRGRRDVLNALLALNPDAARKLHDLNSEGEFTNTEGRLPFDVVFWVTAVADQLGIEPRE